MSKPKMNKYRAVWYGGYNYVFYHPDVELFPNLGVMKYELLARRYDGIANITYADDRGFLNTRTPVVDEFSEFQILSEDNSEVIGRMYFGPRGGIRVDWSV